MHSMQEQEAIFCSEALRLAQAAYACWREGNLEDLGEIASVLAKAGNRTHTEITHRKWLSASVQVSYLAAQLLADYQLWDRWAQRCIGAHKSLTTGMRERHKCGWPYNAFFNARVSVGTIIADGKWKSPEKYRDTVTTLEVELEEYAQLDHEFFTTADPDILGNSSYSQVSEMLAWTGIHLVKCCLRYGLDTSSLSKLLKSRHTFLVNNKLSPLFWDLYIFELWNSGELTEASYRAASANRLAALRKLRGPGIAIDTFVAGTIKERKLLGLSVPDLEVI